MLETKQDDTLVEPQLEPQQSNTMSPKPQTQTQSNSLTDYFAFLYRIKLNVTVEAPIIIVPQNSESNNALLLDCGTITVKTNLEILKSYYTREDFKINADLVNDRCSLPPIIEVQKVSLSNMVVSRVILKQDLNVLSELSLVDCSELKLVVKRNLQPVIFKFKEAILVEAIYDGLLVSIAKSDYTFIIELLQNLNEKFTNTDKDLDFVVNADNAKEKKRLKRNKSHTSTSSLKDLKNILDIDKSGTTSNNNEKYSDVPNMSVKLYIHSIKMYLHEKESKLTDAKVVRSNKDAFSKMELKSLQTEFNIYDNSDAEKDIMKIIFLLDSISLDDTRQMADAVKRKKPNKLIERYVIKNTIPKSMINVAFESKQVRENEECDTEYDSNFIPEKKISTQLSNLRMCVNVDYLLLLHEFFVDGLPPKKGMYFFWFVLISTLYGGE